MRCPSCDERVPNTARRCRFCGERLTASPARKRRGKPRRQQKQKSSLSTLTIVLIVFGALGAFLLLVVIVTMPAIRQAREAARRSSCKNNLMRIGLGIHEYHDIHSVLPAGHTVDANGLPYHSWRSSLLPFAGQANLYEAINFEEPWNSPSNLRFATTRIENYKCPSNPDQSADTDYVAISGEDTMFTNSGVRFRDVTDGTSQTIAIGEGHDLGIGWMEPRDVPLPGLPPLGAPGGFGSHHGGGAQFVMGDGSVRFITDDVDPETFRRLMQRNDGQPVELP